jgi:outer membrane lipoprotein SlyB
MTNLKMMMRGSAVVVALAAAMLVQGCTMPQTNASAGGVYTADYAAALDSAMTSDQAGE